jgi:hypothetical protein
MLGSDQQSKSVTPNSAVTACPFLAPIERRAQCPLPRKRRAAAGRQKREAIAQAGGYPLNAENRGASRHELDSERYAVEVPIDRGNRCGVFGMRRGACVQRFCPGDEQLHRAVLQYVVRRGCPRAGTSSDGTR